MNEGLQVRGGTEDQGVVGECGRGEGSYYEQGMVGVYNEEEKGKRGRMEGRAALNSWKVGQAG